MTPAYDDLRAIRQVVNDLLDVASPKGLEPYGEDVAEALEGLSAVQDHLHLALQQRRKEAA